MIGDDAAQLSAVTSYFSSISIDADEALGWAAGFQLAARPIHDIVGVLLSSRNKIDDLVAVKEQCMATPVIGFATTRQLLPTSDILRAGASDLIKLPLEAEATARLHAVLRRSYGLHDGVLTVGPISIEPANRCVSVQGAKLHFTKREYEVIQMLGLRHDRAVSKEAIAARRHGLADQRTKRLVDDCICRMRKKLRFACQGAEHIITHLDRRYIFTGSPGTT